MKKRKMLKKCIGLILCVSLIISILQSIGGMYSVHAGNDDGTMGKIEITKADFKLYDQDGKEISPIDRNTKVKEGQKVSFLLEWKLDNTSDIKDFSIDLGEYLKLTNLDITDTKGTLFDSSNNEIGTYEIVGNVLTYHLNSNIEYSGERTGGANFNGVVHTDLDEEDDGTQFEIGITGKTVTVTYDADLDDSDIYVWKTNSANGKSLYWKDGRLYQNYTVTIGGLNGKSTITKIQDQYGSGLTNMSDVTIVDAPVGLKLKGSTLSMEELIEKLEGATFDHGDRLEFTYSMEVDPSIAGSDSYTSDDYKNKFTVGFTDNKGGDDSKSDDATVYFRKPEINKSGVIQDNGMVKWTITIYLNDIYDADKGSKLEDYIKEAIKDIPGIGHKDQAEFEINVSDFTKVSEGVYSYTYEAELSDEYKNSSSRLTVHNHVETTIQDVKYEKDGRVETNGRDWVSKDAVEYDADSKTITWVVTLDTMPQGITELKVKDYTNSWNQNAGAHTLNTTISVREKGSTASTTVVENGILVREQNIVIGYLPSNVSWDKSATLVFDNDYCAKMANKTIEIIFKSTVEDESINNKVYYNSVDVSYEENDESFSMSAGAEWSRDNAVQKTGTVINGKNGIHYNVRVDLTGMGGLKAGQNLVLKDTISEDMELDMGSVKLTAYRNTWTPIYNFPGKVTVSQSGNVITFTMNTTQELINLIGNDRVDINIEYDTYLTNEAAVDLTMSGESKTYTNTVEGEYNGTAIGDDFTDNVLTPQNMISKNFKYDEATAPNVEYTIEINPEAYDFSSDDKLIIEDEIGSALSHDLSSIKLEKKSGNTWVLLKNKVDYSYSYDQKNRILTLEVPDATALRLTYRAKVNAYIDRDDPSKNEQLTEENSYNVCRLKGSGSDKTADRKAVNRFAITPSVWAYGTSVTINKYWNDEDGNFATLPGAVFTLYEVAYDKETGTLGAQAATPFKDNIVVDENGQFSLGDLSIDHVYALYEKTAPAGFEKNDEPYYFVIPGSSQVTVPEDVQKLVAGTPLYYENKKINNGSGNLIITKTIKGDVTREEAEGALAFTVTDTATGLSTTYTLKQFTYDESTGVYTLSLPRSVGDYIVEETVSDINGYVTESVTYTINGGASVSGKQATVSVEKDQDTVIAFEDNYKKTSSSGMGSLVITKKITGSVTREEAEGTLRFKVTNNSTGQVTELTLKDFKYDANTGLYTYTLSASAGGYTVEETVYDISGHKLQSVTYRVNGGTAANGTSAKAEVSVGQTTTVAFEDNYTKVTASNATSTPGKTAKSTKKPKATPTKKTQTSKKTKTNSKKTTTTSSSSDTPDTGDQTRGAYYFYYIIMGISLIGFVVLGILSKRKIKRGWKVLS